MRSWKYGKTISDFIILILLVRGIRCIEVTVTIEFAFIQCEKQQQKCYCVHVRKNIGTRTYVYAVCLSYKYKHLKCKALMYEYRTVRYLLAHDDSQYCQFVDEVVRISAFTIQ